MGVFAALLALVPAPPAAARFRFVAPVNVRIVAYVGEALQGIRPDFTWTVTYQGKSYKLSILKLIVQGGGATPLDIDAAVRPYPTQFRLAGDKQALARFVEVPPRQQVVMRGFLRLSAAGRFFMLSAVEFAALPTPAVTP